MKPTGLITESNELSLGLKKLLKKAGYHTFFEISRKTRLGLKQRVKGLTVRHLATLTEALKVRGLSFYPDDSIYLDTFINQRKLFNLWRDGIYTYKQLDEVTFEEFQFYMGGPQSHFFRNNKGASAWLKEHGMHISENRDRTLRFSPYLCDKTSKLLNEAGVISLMELIDKSDYEIALKLQPDFGTKGRISPLTRARLAEIKYVFFKMNIERPCKPL